MFIEDPISLGLLITAFLFVAGSALRDFRQARRKRAAALEAQA